jgi:hypothetical protein
MSTTSRAVLLALAAVVSAVGLGVGLNAAGPAAEPAPAGPRPAATSKPVMAPRQAEEKLDKAVAAAREKAARFLKLKQSPRGTWEDATGLTLAGMDGGMTALATLALLEAGVPADDAAVTKAVEYLVKLEPSKTYVVSLQTQVLARLGDKKHLPQIQKNVDWLLKEAIRKDGKLESWSYPGNQIGDMSNTHFAVVGLHAAAGAGAKIDAKLWRDIRDLYARTQLPDGGWGYSPAVGGERRTNSMTAAGLVALAIAAKYDKDAKGPYPEFEKGVKLLVPWDMESSGKSTGYALLTVAELGRALGASELKSGEKTWAWYREGAAKLVKVQNEDGSITFRTGIDTNPVLGTAFGLYFLGPPQKK